MLPGTAVPPIDAEIPALMVAAVPAAATGSGFTVRVPGDEVNAEQPSEVTRQAY